MSTDQRHTRGVKRCEAQTGSQRHQGSTYRPYTAHARTGPSVPLLLLYEHVEDDDGGLLVQHHVVVGAAVVVHAGRAALGEGTRTALHLEEEQGEGASVSWGGLWELEAGRQAGRPVGVLWELKAGRPWGWVRVGLPGPGPCTARHPHSWSSGTSRVGRNGQGGGQWWSVGPVGVVCGGLTRRATRRLRCLRVSCHTPRS